MTVLVLTACAVLAGARSLLAMGEWVADAPPALLEPGTPPSPEPPGPLFGGRARPRGPW